MQHYLKLQQNNACEGPQQHKRLSCRILFALLIFLPTLGWAQEDITSLSSITNMAGHYRLTANVSGAGHTTITGPFTGTLEAAIDPATKMPYRITDLDAPLFTTLSGTVKNLVLENVSISQNVEVGVGAIACMANGSARIYNVGILSGSVGNTGVHTSDDSKDCCGGLVGLLDGSARVINCYSYANITGGNYKAGIVGYNSYASKYNDLRTMVMNCMFYGDIATGNKVFPIYGGSEISNDYKANTGNRLNNYNYFLYEAPFSLNNHTDAPTITAYNCALAAEERFLIRFEFYRHLLNSNRELAAWYATGNAANGYGVGTNNKMLKWVLDKTIAPYPIIKENGSYPSVVNYDPVNTINPATGASVARTSITIPNQGGIVTTLGTNGQLTINIQMGNGGAIFNKPADATITTASLTRPIIDKDTAQFNFNYGKVQLPYYNEVGTKNYTGNRVVTGWKIVSMTGGTPGGYTETNYDAPNYNYADRDHYGKDIYTSGTGNSGRIFAQGGYFNVPTGVTAITIEPYWARCAYLSNKYYDRYGYNTTDDLSQIGGSHYEASTPTITIDGSTQTVYTTLANARSSMGTNYETGSTVYDHVIVLVGNYHHHTNDAAGEGDELNSVTEKPLTITSVDLNKDNEPDYCLIFRSGKQKPVASIRYDFITLPGMAMAMKMATHTNLAIPGNCKPRGWFEVTTTGLIKFGQFEHSWEQKTLAPLIFMGGVIEQIVSNNSNTGINYTNKTKYMLFGDNVWFKLMCDGTHSDKTSPTPHRPISITGGEYEALYLSGYQRPDATACTAGNGDRNAECYIDGGKFGEVAGAGQELISGNVTWSVNHADIMSFYGGGINKVNPLTGNINTTIKNSRITLFCGGPKFGDMYRDEENPQNNKTVTTDATDCVIGTFFGGGYGGTAIYRDRIQNMWEALNYAWNSWITGSYDKASETSYRGKYTSGKGVSVGYEYEFFGGSKGNVGRLYIDYASFSLAQVNDVTSRLTGCTVLVNFYGGGSLGAVAGNAASTLTNCIVGGNVYGAGYSVQMPTVEVLDNGGYAPEPYYNLTTAIYEKEGLPGKKTYTWAHGTVAGGNSALVNSNNTIITNDETTGLGKVTGDITLILKGTTHVTGNVYGGGETSAVDGNTTVNLQEGATVLGNVYGGGNQGFVSGDSSVIIQATPPPTPPEP